MEENPVAVASQTGRNKLTNKLQSITLLLSPYK